APVERVESGIVGSGDPGRAAAGQPRFAFPGLQGLLGVLFLVLGAGDGVEAPLAFAGLGVVGVDEAANAVLGPADAHDHLALDDQRSDRRAVGELVDVLHFLAVRAGDGDGLVPDGLTGIAVEADDV